jgi:ferredoxin
VSGWTVQADLDLCQGHQECQLEAPDIFGWDHIQRKVTVLQLYPADELRPEAARAVRHCPAMALTIREDS